MEPGGTADPGTHVEFTLEKDEATRLTRSEAEACRQRYRIPGAVAEIGRKPLGPPLDRIEKSLREQLAQAKIDIGAPGLLPAQKDWYQGQIAGFERAVETVEQIRKEAREGQS